MLDEFSLKTKEKDEYGNELYRVEGFQYSRGNVFISINYLDAKNTSNRSSKLFHIYDRKCEPIKPKIKGKVDAINLLKFSDQNFLYLYINTELCKMDLDGNLLERKKQDWFGTYMKASPDFKRILCSEGKTPTDILVYDIDRNMRTTLCKGDSLEQGVCMNRFWIRNNKIFATLLFTDINNTYRKTCAKIYEVQ
ncbi:MAG: hypothetical protein N2645_12925 [Clostridia bacterium]|nr:hypothetical protein [Clostridia bacterium]